jgi:hypothetical protein
MHKNVLMIQYKLDKEVCCALFWILKLKYEMFAFQ